MTAMLIIGETWRSSRNQSKRRDDVDDRLDDLSTRLEEIYTSLDGFALAWEDRLQAERLR
jgi:optic atrophy 3 protein